MFPTCWDCYTGEWSLHVGIAMLVNGPICWDCYIGGVFIDVGIAILPSGPHMLVLLLW